MGIFFFRQKISHPSEFGIQTAECSATITLSDRSCQRSVDRDSPFRINSKEMSELTGKEKGKEWQGGDETENAILRGGAAMKPEGTE